MGFLEAGRTLGSSNDRNAKQKAIKPQTKIERILQAFVSGENLHRFEAFKYRDTCLHSSVSSLEQGYGLLFKRRTVMVQRQGDPVRVTEYSLNLGSLGKAAKVLSRMRQRREQPNKKTGC